MTQPQTKPTLVTSQYIYEVVYALLAKAGGTVDMTFEEFGEGVMTDRLKLAAVGVERTATGIRISQIPNPHAAAHQ